MRGPATGDRDEPPQHVGPTNVGGAFRRFFEFWRPRLAEAYPVNSPWQTNWQICVTWRRMSQDEKTQYELLLHMKTLLCPPDCWEKLLKPAQQTENVVPDETDWSRDS